MSATTKRRARLKTWVTGWRRFVSIEWWRWTLSTWWTYGWPANVVGVGTMEVDDDLAAQIAPEYLIHCDDDNPCTDDNCDDDKNAPVPCAAAECFGGSDNDCDDGNACTRDRE